VSGTLDGASFNVQFRSSEALPIDDTAQIGECVWSSASTKWSDCKNPSFTPDTVGVGTLVLPFTDFAGGVPVDSLDPSGLLGLQLQFGCGAAAGCEVELVLDQLRFE